MKKMFKGCLTLIGAVVVIGIIIAIFSGDDEEQSSNNESNQEDAAKVEDKEESQVKTTGIGETATVADVGFTASNVKETEVINSGSEYTENATTSGKFVILDVKIDNGKKESLTIDSSFFKLQTADGVEYDPTTSGTVTMALGMESDFFLTQINPGLSKSGKVVFEVPADMDVANAQLKCQTGFFGTESIKINLK